MIKPYVIIFAIVCVIVMVLTYLLQRNLIYFPNRQRPVPEDYQAADMQVISLRTQDGLLLNCWYKPAAKNRPTLLYLHGNAGHIGHRMPMAREFIAAGYGVLLLDYRGYGGNKGRPTEQGLYEDGRTAVRYLQQQGVKARELVLYGESLGTGVATMLAVEYPVCAVVLQSPFTSMANLAHYHYPWILMKPWDQFNSLSRISAIHAPLLVLHGKQDEVVPFAQGLAIFEDAQEPKKMAYYEQSGHNNLWSVDSFGDDVIHFIQTYCG